MYGVSARQPPPTAHPPPDEPGSQILHHRTKDNLFLYICQNVLLFFVTTVLALPSEVSSFVLLLYICQNVVLFSCTNHLSLSFDLFRCLYLYPSLNVTMWCPFSSRLRKLNYISNLRLLVFMRFSLFKLSALLTSFQAVHFQQFSLRHL